MLVFKFGVCAYVNMFYVFECRQPLRKSEDLCKPQVLLLPTLHFVWDRVSICWYICWLRSFWEGILPLSATPHRSTEVKDVRPGFMRALGIQVQVLMSWGKHFEPFIDSVHVSMHERMCTHAMACMWKLEDNLWPSVLPFNNCMCSRDWTQAIRLYLLSYLGWSLFVF